MSKLHDMIAFGEAEDQAIIQKRSAHRRSVRATLTWVLGVSLLGLILSSATTYREYASATESARARIDSSISLFGLRPWVYVLAVDALLVALATSALWRTRRGVGDDGAD